MSSKKDASDNLFEELVKCQDLASAERVIISADSKVFITSFYHFKLSPNITLVYNRLYAFFLQSSLDEYPYSFLLLILLIRMQSKPVQIITKLIVPTVKYYDHGLKRVFCLYNGITRILSHDGHYFDEKKAILFQMITQTMQENESISSCDTIKALIASFGIDLFFNVIASDNEVSDLIYEVSQLLTDKNASNQLIDILISLLSKESIFWRTITTCCIAQLKNDDNFVTIAAVKIFETINEASSAFEIEEDCEDECAEEVAQTLDAFNQQQSDEDSEELSACSDDMEMFDKKLEAYFSEVREKKRLKKQTKEAAKNLCFKFLDWVDVLLRDNFILFIPFILNLKGKQVLKEHFAKMTKRLLAKMSKIEYSNICDCYSRIDINIARKSPSFGHLISFLYKVGDDRARERISREASKVFFNYLSKRSSFLNPSWSAVFMNDKLFNGMIKELQALDPRRMSHYELKKFIELVHPSIHNLNLDNYERFSSILKLIFEKSVKEGKKGRGYIKQVRKRIAKILSKMSCMSTLQFECNKSE